MGLKPFDPIYQSILSDLLFDSVMKKTGGVFESIIAFRLFAKPINIKLGTAETARPV